MEKNRKDSKIKDSSDLWEYSSLGMEFFLIFMGCFLLGNWLGKKYNFQPWGLLGGLTIGFSYSLYYIIIRTRKIKEKKEEEKDGNDI